MALLCRISEPWGIYAQLIKKRGCARHPLKKHYNKSAPQGRRTPRALPAGACCYNEGAVNISQLLFENELLLSDNTLSEHCVCNLYEACNVSADNIVALVAVLLCSVIDIVVDVDHDLLEFSVNLFKCP